jgi:hypothetical protein
VNSTQQTELPSIAEQIKAVASQSPTTPTNTNQQKVDTLLKTIVTFGGNINVYFFDAQTEEPINDEIIDVALVLNDAVEMRRKYIQEKCYWPWEMPVEQSEIQAVRFNKKKSNIIIHGALQGFQKT